MASSRWRNTAAATLIVFGLLAWVGAPGAAVIHVPTDYATIQGAINAASPGDTVVVASGYYEENDAAWRDMYIGKSLYLVGAGMGQTVVGLSNGKTNGVEIYGSNLDVRIEGMTFTYRTGQTVASGFNFRVGEVATTVTSLVFSDVEVAYGAGRNVFIDGNGTYQAITVEGCSFHHSGAWGFSVRGVVNGITITDSDFEYNGLSDAAHGIGFDIDMPITISNIQVTGGSFSHNKAKGINLVKTVNASFEGIIANSNGGAPGGGFGVSLWEWVSASGSLSFTNSSFSNNSLDGFLFGTEGTCQIDGVTIDECEVGGNSRHGVFFFHNYGGDATNVRVTGCDLSGNSGRGIATSAKGALVDAPGNWWGSIDPATVRTKADGGGGDKVDYTPWLASGTDTSGDPGFQGDYSALWVDDDSPQSGTAGRIQEGIDLVSGSTVNVAAGTYEEQVEIAKALILDGAGAAQTTIQSPAVLSKYFATSVNNYPVVYVHGANGVVVRDLTVDGLGLGNGNYRFIGIAYYDAGGTIDDCGIVGIRETPISGNQHGVGIYALADQGNARSLIVTDCDVSGYQKNAMALSGADLTTTVDGCVVTGYGPASFIAQNGIQVAFGAQGSIGAAEANTVTGHSFAPHTWAASGILLYGAGGTVLVQNNAVAENSEGIFSVDGSATIEDNVVSATSAGTGVSDYWGVICDPGGAGPFPAAQPFDDLGLPPGGRTTFQYAVNRNVITGDNGAGSVGLDIWCDGTDQLVFTGAQNVIHGFDYGVQVDAEGTGLIQSVDLNWNSIEDNATYGLYNNNASTGIEVDAENNWWGDASGPYEGTTNPSGTGNPVSPFVDYDPWVGKSGGENIVVVNDPEYLTATNPVKTVSVDYLGGGSGLVYGYSVKFSWDGAVVSTATNKVTEGDLLNSQGSTRFFKNVSGTNEITVDCVLLGDQPGASGPGTMFTIEFTGLSVGTSPVDVTVISVRDKYNQDLVGFYENDGLLIVDESNPSVTDVWIENLTLAHTDDYIKDTDAARVTATVADDDPAFGIAHIKANLTGLGGGASASPDSYVGNVATWNIASATCAPANGTVTVTVTATDPIGNTASDSDDIIADNTPPGAIMGFDASPHHERVSMTWSNPSGLDTYYYGVLVRYDGGGDYPEYATSGVYPSDPTGGDGDAYNQIGVVTGGDHNIAARDIYHYTAFAYDWALNYGPAASSAKDRATNYWLGDVDVNTGPGGGDYDGDVDFEDISVLSAAYWMTAPASPHNECDVGRTDTGSPFGIPVPDDRVNFEDLMVFALNFNVVTPSMKSSVVLAGNPEAGSPVLRLLEAEDSDDGTFALRLALGGNESEVKGASVVIRYDPERAEYAGFVPSAALGSGGVMTFARESSPGTVEFDWAVLGAGRTVHGTGDLALVRFIAKGEDAGSFRLENARVRDVNNGALTAAAEGLEMSPASVAPQATRLAGVWPNPFNPNTVVRFDLSRSEHVTVRVYDPQGRVVRTLADEARAAGRYEIAWDGVDGSGRAAASGTYFVRMEAGSYRSTTKITLVR